LIFIKCVLVRNSRLKLASPADRTHSRQGEFSEKVMYKRILVAIDGSQAAQLALEEALKIAEATQAIVTAVFVAEHTARLVDVGTGLIDAQPRTTAYAEAAKATLEDARAMFEQRKVRGLTRTIDAYGEDITGVLCRAADEWEADLVVMGTHGRHGIGRLLLGSVAEALLRRTTVPVLMVRREFAIDEIPSSL
jgi:nucleotide-binding universal stress UspA family protein